MARAERQSEFLDKPDGLDRFHDRLKDADLWPLKTTTIDVLQINLGKMCKGGDVPNKFGALKKRFLPL